MFNQHVNININNTFENQEFMKICSEHPKCIDCPLKHKDIQLQTGIIRCETGRVKR